MNGIPALAQAVQSQGRGNDTQLVHMTPREVQGLESLAMAYGGSLTTNPRTGLKEAGFLEDILPTVAGAALTIGTGGAINPLTAGLIVGGTTGVLTGSLEKGLMAGLGAYGGGGLGQGLTAAGANAAQQAAITTSTGQAPAALAAQGGSSVGAGTLPADMTAALKGGASYGTSSAPTMGYNFSQAGEGFKALGTEAGRGAFMSEAGVGGLGGLAKYGGAAIAPAMLGGEQPGITPDAGTIRPYTYDPGRQDVQYRTGAPGESTAEQRYFTPTFTPLPTFTPGSGSSAEQEDERRRMGVMALAAGSQGPVRMLRGGGDATSDSMDGVIDGKEPVRLATGEVVIDGRAVSEIGNGDNEAGAKKIEAAIERIHKIRQKAKRGKPSNADKTFASMIA